MVLDPFPNLFPYIFLGLDPSPPPLITHPYVQFCLCIFIWYTTHSCVLGLLHCHVWQNSFICVTRLIHMCGTGWRRLIGSPKLQIIFHQRANKYRSLLRKMTYNDKGSYESSPPCIAHSYVRCNSIIETQK